MAHDTHTWEKGTIAFTDHQRNVEMINFPRRIRLRIPRKGSGYPRFIDSEKVMRRLYRMRLRLPGRDEIALRPCNKRIDEYPTIAQRFIDEPTGNSVVMP